MKGKVVLERVHYRPMEGLPFVRGPAYQTHVVQEELHADGVKRLVDVLHQSESLFGVQIKPEITMEADPTDFIRYLKIQLTADHVTDRQIAVNWLLKWVIGKTRLQPARVPTWLKCSVLNDVLRSLPRLMARMAAVSV